MWWGHFLGRDSRILWVSLAGESPRLGIHCEWIGRPCAASGSRRGWGNRGAREKRSLHRGIDGWKSAVDRQLLWDDSSPSVVGVSVAHSILDPFHSIGHLGIRWRSAHSLMPKRDSFTNIFGKRRRILGSCSNLRCQANLFDYDFMFSLS